MKVVQLNVHTVKAGNGLNLVFILDRRITGVQNVLELLQLSQDQVLTGFMIKKSGHCTSHAC